MYNVYEESDSILQKYSKTSIIDEVLKKADEERIKYIKFKNELIEWEGALVRAHLKFKKIKYKRKGEKTWVSA